MVKSLSRGVWREAAAVAIGCIVAATLGCGGDDRIPLVPTSGTVTVKGLPAGGAKVIFSPIDAALQGSGKPLPTGLVGSDGKFALTSYQPNDGAPAGQYEVSVIWPEVVKPSDDPEQVVTRDRLKDRYAVPSTSGLKATIDENTPVLPPFELQ